MPTSLECAAEVVASQRNKYVMTVVASAVNLISTLAIPAASSVIALATVTCADCNRMQECTNAQYCLLQQAIVQQLRRE
jgi:hypothetical protein